jgi:tRNA threonylcarbamoyl adenosine modification protein (Sua5/YciO/YrdC/YwlC family)
VDAFWPGPLTILVEHTPTLQWDLGDTQGTVSVRMPLHPVALEVLRETGPMAVSSASRDGASPALTAQQAIDQFGPSVSVYLDAGACPAGLPSSVVDLTGPVPQLLRAGALELDTLRAVLPQLRGPGE